MQPREIAFFPNVYNEDWFFFADEVAIYRIANASESRQRRSNSW